LNPRCPYFTAFLLPLHGLSRPCTPFLLCQKEWCAVGSKNKSRQTPHPGACTLPPASDNVPLVLSSVLKGAKQN
jgi:hypothetical protein